MNRQCAYVCWLLLMLFTFCIEKANSHLPFPTESRVNSHHEGDKYSLVSDKDEAAEAMAAAALSFADNVTTIHQHYHTEANYWDRRGRQRRRRQASHRVIAAASTCNNLFSPPPDFLVIGHAGGDPLNQCENTLEATRSALQQGANAIEVDLSVSADGQVFLWHDPSPLSLHAIARRLGYTLPGKCRPSMSFNDDASQLKWSDIRQHWFYDDLSLGGYRSPSVIPTLAEWMREFAGDTRLQLIWLDVKVRESWEIVALVRALASILHQHHVPFHRIQFSTHEVAIASKLQGELIRQGLDPFASKVVMDTVPYTSYIRDVHHYNGINKALKSLVTTSTDKKICGCCVNLGKPIIGSNKWTSLQKIVNYNVAQRNVLSKKFGSYHGIFVWTIDDPQQMKWLISSGIDGIITNQPKKLVQLVRNQTHIRRPRFNLN